MGISRQTFGNIINSAHKKIADFVVNGKILKVEGGNVVLENTLIDDFHRQRRGRRHCRKIEDFE
jgi:tRNA A37 N6-isopentenylltransferase MiaA